MKAVRIVISCLLVLIMAQNTLAKEIGDIEGVALYDVSSPFNFDDFNQKNYFALASFSHSEEHIPSIDSLDGDYSSMRTYALSQSLGLACSTSNVNKEMIPKERKWIAVIDRGECTFAEKVLNVQQLGASLAIITSTVSGLTNSTTGVLNDPCSVDCSIYSSSSKDDCESNCPSSYCLEPKLSSSESKYCCVVDELIGIGFGKDKSKIKIPVLSTTIEEGNKIKGVANSKEVGSVIVGVYVRHLAEVDGSIIVIGILGVGTVIAASYRASRKERISAWRVLGYMPIVVSEIDQEQENERNLLEEVEAGETVDLGVRQAVSFLACSTMMLVVLFFVVMKWPHLVVIVLEVCFGIGAASSLSFMIIQPLLYMIAKGLFKAKIQTLSTSRGELIAFTLSLVFSISWFVLRHKDYSWILQDILAVSLILSILLVIRIQSLRVATFLLSLFFFYDIFMVFISPSLFGGKSVMVEVATAGSATKEAKDNGECIRNAEERMPMLLAVPRFDWIGGYSMLGLGDIFIPGLIVSFAIRVDYARCEKDAEFNAGESSHLLNGQIKSVFPLYYYWIPVCIAYAVGLSLAFTANIQGWTFGTGVR